MSRMVGTVSRGIRAPIIRSGDNLVEIVTQSVLEAAKEEGFSLRDRDVIAMTEAIVARAQGNYAGVDDIAADVKAKLGGETVGVIFPILSRNRFAICLRGIARGRRKSSSCSPTPPTRWATTWWTSTWWTRRGLTPTGTCSPWSSTAPSSVRLSTPSPAWTMWTTTPSSSGRAVRRWRSSSPTTPGPF